jgi:hypothetical protein
MSQVPPGAFCNIQLGNAIRAHPKHQTFTSGNLALPRGTRYVFVQYEPAFTPADVNARMVTQDITEWIYRVGTIAADYRHVRCAVIAPVTQKGVVTWQGTVWDLDDRGQGIKKVAVHNSPWVYNDPTRGGFPSGYVFYGTTTMTDTQIGQIGTCCISSFPIRPKDALKLTNIATAGGFARANAIYTLQNNNCSKFAHYIANQIANQHGAPAVVRLNNHFAAKISVLSRHAQRGQIVQAYVAP